MEFYKTSDDWEAGPSDSTDEKINDGKNKLH